MNTPKHWQLAFRGDGKHVALILRDQSEERWSPVELRFDDHKLHIDNHATLISAGGSRQEASGKSSH